MTQYGDYSMVVDKKSNIYSISNEYVQYFEYFKQAGK